MAAAPTSNPATSLLDPALGLASDRAAGRAIAVEMAAVTALWITAFDGGWRARFTIPGTVHALLLMAAAAGAGLLLGPIAARARRAVDAAGRAVGLGIAGGCVVTVITAPLAHAGTIWAAGVTRSHIVADDAFCGAIFGLFAGLMAALLAARHVQIRRVPALDGAPRLYAAAGVALLVPATALLLVGVVVPGVPLLGAAAALGAFAVRASRRRLAWLARVREGSEPAFRIDAVTEAGELAALPAFIGASADGGGALLRATEPRGATPYRDGGPWGRVARVSLDPSAASLEANRALWRAAGAGALDGMVLVVGVAAPVMLASLAIGD
jgi:hypothetical protein